MAPPSSPSRTPSAGPLPPLFDRLALRLRRRRARGTIAAADYLLMAAAMSMAERLQDIRRSFATAVVLPARSPRAIATLRATGRIGQLWAMDLVPGPGVVALADEEALPLAPGRLDLMLSLGGLHTVNDLPGALIQMRRALRPDGLLLACLPGDETLATLRQALLAAEGSLTGGASPRVAPMAEMRDLGGLLQRAGFALPVVDKELVEVTFPSLAALMADLRAMGETSVLWERTRRVPPRALFAMADALWRTWPGAVTPEGQLLATFELVHLSGWAPAESQQQPAQRGSGTVDLARFLGDPEPL